MSINLVQHPPEGATLCMSLESVCSTCTTCRCFQQCNVRDALHFNGRLPEGKLLNHVRGTQMRHAGDHSTVATASNRDLQSSQIVRRTLAQQYISWPRVNRSQTHSITPSIDRINKWWQCVTYVTIEGTIGGEAVIEGNAILED